jgi:polysaccharide pyruvyl transferase WcaK-like protein
MNVSAPLRQPRSGNAASDALSGANATTVSASKHVPARTIAVFGLFGVGNHGNDGSLEVMLDFLRRERPDAELVCICGNPSVVSETFDIAAVPISWSGGHPGSASGWRRRLLSVLGKAFGPVNAYRHIRRADVMVIPGTGILDDFCETPSGMPLHLFVWCLAARAAGVRLALVSIGAGPIRHRLSRWFLISAARMAQFRSYRDQISKDFMTDAGVDTRNDLVQPDLVFNMRTPRERTAEEGVDGRLCVGVGVMGYRGWYGFADAGRSIHTVYIEKMVRFVEYVLGAGHDVRLLIGDSGDDKAAVEEILTGVAGHICSAGQAIETQPIASLHDLMDQIAQTDVVVATRFHNVVGALKMARPTISLGYALKNDVLMEEMGLGDFCHHVESFDVDALIRKFSQLLEGRHEHRQHITARTKEYLKRLERQERHLLADFL